MAKTLKSKFKFRPVVFNNLTYFLLSGNGSYFSKHLVMHKKCVEVLRSAHPPISINNNESHTATLTGTKRHDFL